MGNKGNVADRYAPADFFVIKYIVNTFVNTLIL